MGAALGAVSGVLVILSAPGHAFGWLVLVAGVPMLVAQHQVLEGRYAGLAPALTYGIAAWGTLAVMLDGAVATPLVWGGVTLIAVGAGVAGTVERALWQRVGYRWWIVAGPVAWAMFGLVRLRLPFAGSAGFLAHHLARHPAVLQPVSVVGLVGLEAAIAAVNIVVAAVVLGAVGHPAFARPAVWWLASGLPVGLGIWLSWSLALLDDPPATVRVAAVQRGFDDVLARFDEDPTADLDGMLVAGTVELTRAAAAQGAQLVVWPEYGLAEDPCREGAGRGDGAAVRRLAEQTGLFIVVGYGTVDDVAAGAGDTGDRGASGHVERNEAVLITPHGQCLGPYAKQHPVWWIGERSDTDHGAPVFDTALGRLAMVICYDLDFTDVSRTLGADGAQLVAAPSADWPAIARYHTAPLVFRSIENQVATVKADTAYDSAVIDPHGRILAEDVSPDGATALVMADVPLGPGHPTIWNRFAPLIDVAWLVTGTAIATALVRSYRRQLADTRNV